MDAKVTGDLTREFPGLISTRVFPDGRIAARPQRDGARCHW